LKSFARPSPVRVRRSRRARALDVEIFGTSRAPRSRRSVASPRLARTVVRRPPRSRGRRHRNQSRRRGRGVAGARVAARGCAPYIKYEAITYTLSPKTPIYRSINRTHPRRRN
jgi:hypothetical protein